MKDGDLIPVSVKEISPNGLGNLSLKFIPEDGKIFPGYSAGAHIDIMIPGIGPRQYSLCGMPDQRQSYEICVKLGAVSSGGSAICTMSLNPATDSPSPARATIFRCRRLATCCWQAVSA